jgi:hypothetical protein
MLPIQRLEITRAFCRDLAPSFDKVVDLDLETSRCRAGPRLKNCDNKGGYAMKVMVLVKASKASEAGEMPSEQLVAEMGQYNEELVKAGILLAAEGLHPSSKGVRVRFSGDGRTVTDGPFAETKELVAGYWLWRVKSMAEAIEWVKRCPNPMPGESEIEIRPVFDAEDFAPSDPSGELRAAERRLRAEAKGLATS